MWLGVGVLGRRKRRPLAAPFALRSVGHLCTGMEIGGFGSACLPRSGGWRRLGPISFLLEGVMAGRPTKGVLA